MKRARFLYFCLLLLFMTGCMMIPVPRDKICDCCGTTYTSIQDALACIDQHPNTSNHSDERLLLLAFVTQDLKANQQLGWNILQDPKIIKTAQRNYLLVTLDAGQYNQQKISKYYSDKIFLSHKNDSTFYVIVNQAVYPFGDWGKGASKEDIIDELTGGNGP